MFRLIIAGGRNIWDFDFIKEVFEYYTQNLGEWTLVCGMAPGVDTVSKDIAEAKDIPIDKHPADWDGLGKKAGPVRNEEMANVADGLLAIWDGTSPGTKDMIDRARNHGLKVKVVMYEK